MPRRKSSPTGESLLAAVLIFLGALAWSGWGTASTNVRIAIIATFIGLIVFTIYLLVRAVRMKRVHQTEERWRLSAMNLRMLSPTEFEREVEWVFGINIEWCTTRHVGRAGDRGIDVEMLDSNGKVRGIVQCKHRSDPNETIAPTAIRDMDSTRHRHNIEHAFVVTNARFSAASEDLAKQYNIHLVDGVRFEKFRQKAYAKFYQSQQQGISTSEIMGESQAPVVAPIVTPPIIAPPALNPTSKGNQRLANKPVIDLVERQLEERRERLQAKAGKQ